MLIPFALLALSARVGSAQTLHLDLDAQFVSRVKAEATLSVDYWTVGVSGVHDPDADAEVHIGGHCLDLTTGADLGFATVAEILHAKKYTSLLAWLESQTGTVRMRGVWRLWSEHGKGSFVQGSYPSSWYPPSNPNHVFELHPLVDLKKGSTPISFLGDFTFIDGFPSIGTAAPAVQRTKKAFTEFETYKCAVSRSGGRIVIDSDPTNFNFVEFKAKITKKAVATPSGDGFVAYADISPQTAGPVLAKGRRLIFVKDTDPAKAAKQAAVGDTMLLVGFARISLYEIASAGSELNRLPYEMIVQSLDSGTTHALGTTRKKRRRRGKHHP